jgi:hypothetical protein
MVEAGIHSRLQSRRELHCIHLVLYLSLARFRKAATAGASKLRSGYSMKVRARRIVFS